MYFYGVISFLGQPNGGGYLGFKMDQNKTIWGTLYGSTPVIGGLEVAPLSFHFRFNHLGSWKMSRQVHTTTQIEENSSQNTFMGVLGYIDRHIRK